MALSTHVELVEGIVYSPLGGTILPQEQSIQKVDYDRALLRYYTYNPIKITRTYEVGVDREVSQEHNALLPSADYFYVGLLHVEPRTQLGLTRFDEVLLGAAALPSPRYTPEHQLLASTMVDLSVGDVYQEENNVEGVTRFVLGGSCILAAIWGIGHSDLNKVPHRNLEYVAQLVGVQYYERLLAVRKTGAFKDSDFSLDTSVLQASYEYFKEKSEEMTMALNLTAVTKG